MIASARRLPALLAASSLLLVVTGLLLVLTAGPAMAHGRGSDASNYLSLIEQAPDLDGVTVEVVNADEYLLLTNTSEVEVQIPGYLGEPYLRIGPEGVFENANSQATYVNEERYGDVAVPPDVDPTAEPEWRQVSTGSTYAWHDHRIHWMVEAEPAPVQAEPGSEHLINAWSVPVIAGDVESEITGELFWVPGGSPWVWLIPALLVVSLPVGLAMIRTEPDPEAYEWRGLSRVAGAVLLVIGLANVIHLVDDLFATPIPLSEAAVTAIQTFFFIVIAVFGAARAIQGAEGAFTALGVSSAAIFIGQGVLYFSVLGASQTASLFDGSLTRVVIALSCAQVIPMAVATVRGTRAVTPEWDEGDLAAEASAAGG